MFSLKCLIGQQIFAKVICSTKDIVFFLYPLYQLITGGLEQLNTEICRVDVLKFGTLVTCQKRPRQTNSADLDQTASEEAVRSGSSVCYSDKHFVKLSPVCKFFPENIEVRAVRSVSAMFG